jgi:hypothetical protein
MRNSLVRNASRQVLFIEEAHAAACPLPTLRAVKVVPHQHAGMIVSTPATPTTAPPSADQLQSSAPAALPASPPAATLRYQLPTPTTETKFFEFFAPGSQMVGMYWAGTYDIIRVFMIFRFLIHSESHSCPTFICNQAPKSGQWTGVASSKRTVSTILSAQTMNFIAKCLLPTCRDSRTSCYRKCDGSFSCEYIPRFQCRLPHHRPIRQRQMHWRTRIGRALFRAPALVRPSAARRSPI